jgi:hypothetical protein
MIRSKIAMGFLWALLVLALHVVPGAVGPAHAQGTRKDDIVFNSRGIPLAGATVRVCAMPASGQPCTPLALIYSDAALTQALANPTTTDGLGNYFFYAAPGKYEIEISGPAITTKQIPNVILPNDPASPTFSGAVSAFSLTLSGNLTVSGNTTVVGNLASGTLNLANQSAPPGSATSGTVNLYTKTADKRLYYKDDTGTEVGPLGSGAQTTVVNTFTADQNFDGNTYPKGPNPYIDMARYGGYFGANGGTTASCTSGSANVTLAAAQDFLDATKFPATNLGNGIVLYKCGAATGLSTPPAPNATPFGVTGSTTYNYKWVAEDTSGGLTAASAQGSTTTGPASLGINTIALASAVGSSAFNGQQTYTCQANCNLSLYAAVNVAGFATARLNGNYTVMATTATTFTVFSPGSTSAITETNSGATVKVVACNALTGPANMVPNTVENGTTDIVMRWFVYRNNTLAFVVPKRDPYWEDCGVNTPTFPPYVPTSPGSAVNKYLATTIVSGAGTTNIVVANTAGNTVAGQTALHDNSQNLRAALAAGAFSTPVRVNGSAVFNAATLLDGAHGGNGQVWLPFGVAVNQPWVVRTSMSFKGGENNVSTSFTFRPQVPFGAGQYAYPGMLGLFAGPVTSLNAVTFENFSFGANNLTQIPFVYDQDGAFGLMMLNCSFGVSGSNSNLNTPAAWISGVTHSVFGRDGDEWSTSVPQTFGAGAGIRFTTASLASLPVGTSFLSVVAHSVMHGGNFQGGTSLQFDAFPCYFSSGCTSSNITSTALEMKKLLGEQRTGPFIRVGPFVAPNFKIAIVDDDAPNNQPGNGFIDAAASGGGNYVVEDLGSSVTGQVLLSGPGYVLTRNQGLPVGTTLSATTYPGGVASYGGSGFAVAGGNGAIQTYGAAGLGYAFSVPNAPTVVTGAHSSCSSNCVASGTYYYAIVANDITGKNSSESPCSSSVTVDGTQTVTVSWVPIQGQYTTQRFRGAACNNMVSTDVLGSGVNGTSYTDLGSLSYSASGPASSPGNAVAMNSSGLSSNQLTLVSGGYSDSVIPPASGFSANRTQSIPDVTGYIPVTSYVNSGYENATRANGSIGANWTIQQNGLSIASNQIQGATASQSNTGFWNANAFSPVQFAQATITALNGTTDFPGVTVLASGTGASATYYDCVENSMTIYLQRVVNAGTTNLTNTASTGAVGDILRLEVAPGGVLTCFKNGASTLTATDTQITSGSPGLLISGNVATEKNWSGGNLHPLAQLDTEQDWTKPQHFTQGVAFGTETFTASPRGEQNVFLPGALTSAWTGSTWTNDKAVTITRIQVQAKTAPAGCSTNAIVRFTDGTTPVNVTISAAANDSGAIAQNYPAGSSLQILVQTAAAGCTTSPADANVTVQYRMQ